MNPSTNPPRDDRGPSLRLTELLADQATGPLSQPELAELNALLNAHSHPRSPSGLHADAISSISGALIKAWSATTQAALPPDVRARLLDRGLEFARENSSPSATAPMPRLARLAHMAPPTIPMQPRPRPFSWPLLLTAAAASAALCTSLFMLDQARRSRAESIVARIQSEAQNQESITRLAASEARINEVTAALQAQRQEANALLATAAEQRTTLEAEKAALATTLRAERETTAQTAAQAASQIAALQTQLTASERNLSTAQARVALLEQNADNVQIAWTATEIPEAKGVTGDVVWNARLQQGYLRFRGLGANDPSKEQYQAWIFDEGRDPKFPVDAGVFDITLATMDEATGDLIIPIDPKLLIKNPGAFAVTLETPGGVVVTDKKRVVVLAPVVVPPAS